MGADQGLMPVGVEVSRKAQAYAFIRHYIMTMGHSPSIGDVAKALGVGPTRAKALVHQLSKEKAIERAPGAQRAISIPGLFDALVKDRLRRDGWRVDREDIELFTACPQGHLPLVAILEHIPDHVAGDHHAEPSDVGADRALD